MSERKVGDEGAISLAEVMKENTSSDIDKDENGLTLPQSATWVEETTSTSTRKQYG